MRYSLSWSWKPDSNTANRIKDGNRKMRRPELPPNRIEESIMADSTAKKGPKKVAKTNGAKPVSDGVALKVLCKELKVDPRLARRKLRKAEISGHDARDRWTFKPGSSALTKAREVLAA